MKLFLVLINLSLAFLPLETVESASSAFSNAKIKNTFEISKTRFTSNVNGTKTELSAPQIQVKSNLDQIYLLDPLFAVKEKNNSNKTIRASMGHFNRLSNLIEFKENIQIRITSTDNNVLLNTDRLIVDNNNDTIISPSNSYFQADSFHISSKQLTIEEFSHQQNKIIFKYGSIINPDTNERLGSAEEISYSLDSGVLIMNGQAMIKDKTITVLADEIHYNPEDKKIIKSINSKIINNS